MSAPRSDGWALFLDFDGTLVDIAERPEAVVVDPTLPPVLERLQQQLAGALAIVTGRPIATIDDFLSPRRLDVAGLHGVEYRLAGTLHPCRPEEHPALRRAIERLRRRVAEMEGVLVEDKGCSVAVHWRLAPHAEAKVRDLMASMAAELGADYRLQKGKAVIEVLPARAAKGAIIQHFLQHAPYRGRRPIFVGDDLTDELGFEVVNGLGGMTFRIGHEPTCAKRRIATPGELRRCLAAWADQGAIDLAKIGTA